MSIFRRLAAQFAAFFPARAEVERLRAENRELLEECRDLHCYGRHMEGVLQRLTQENDDLRARRVGDRRMKITESTTALQLAGLMWEGADEEDGHIMRGLLHRDGVADTADLNEERWQTLMDEVCEIRHLEALHNL